MVFTALMMGLAGSLHCVGMCSPLAMAVTNLNHSVMFNRIIYNTGRILTYGILGAIVASAGMIFPFSKFQNLLSIIMGVVLLFVGITGIGGIRIPLITTSATYVNHQLKGLFSKFIVQKTHGSILFLGALNGLLPCGLTFLALTYCLTLKGPSDGFNFMLFFGLGTLPVMIGLVNVIQWLVKTFNISIKRMTTVMLILSGLLLIARVFLIHLPKAHSFQEGMVDIVLCR